MSPVADYPIPTVLEVEQIAAIPDPVLRNLRITQCYAELSAALVDRTGLNANWCTFATWASRQAGQSIRGEDLALALERLLGSAPAAAAAAKDVAALARRLGSKRSPEEIYRAIWGSLNLSKAVARTGESVGQGNKKVFEEIGREFARFCAGCLSDPAPDPEKIAGFCAGLRPGDPPDGQRYLKQAFAHLYEAFFEADARRRAELMLLANIEIGYHEQTRLQPEIRAALDGPLMDEAQFIQRLLASFFPRTNAALLQARWIFLRLLGRPPVLELALRALFGTLQVAARQAVTQVLMTISFPKTPRLRLWSDLSGDYPPVLRSPLTHPDLCSLLEQVDPTRDSPLDSGAVDWADLPDRLHFIVDLFRLYQQREDLFEAPFTPEQVAAIRDGWVPDGPL